MTRTDSAADQIEAILSAAISKASALEPAPDNYFMLFNRQLHDNWFLGFLFSSQGDLRAALENGVCYQLHEYVFKSLANSENLHDVKSHIVFDFGDLPESDSEYEKLHRNFVGQLDALRQDSAGEKLVSCKLCGHEIDQHQMRGHGEDGEATPAKGWMICPNKECTCFRTWSLSAERS